MALSYGRRTLRRVLVIRNDRLGDVLLTTPVAGALRQADPGLHIAFLTRPYAAPLLEHNPDIDRVLLDQGEPAAGLARRLREQSFDAALLVSMDRRLAWAARRAGIPLRIGPLRSAWGLLLSRPVRQKRARGTRHEADHNLHLLEPLGIRFRRRATRLELTDAERGQGLERLTALGCTPGERALVVLHPGGLGSAPRWPFPHFLELGRRLVSAGADVVVTAGSGDGVSAPQPRSAGDPLFPPPGSLSLRELAGVLAAARLVVANSTGPLHMAVALGVPTLSVYPGTGTAQAFRWGPYPAYPEGDPVHGVFVAPTRADGTADMAAVPVEALWDECRTRLPELPGARRPGDPRVVRG
jgi:heptosyltransferase-3